MCFLPPHGTHSCLFPVLYIKLARRTSHSLLSPHLTRFSFSFHFLMAQNRFILSRRISHGIPWTALLFYAFHFSAAQPVNQHPPDDDSDGVYTTFDPSMSIVILVLVAAFLLVSLFSVYIRHCAESSSSAAGALPSRAAVSGTRRGLDPAVIESFPIFVYAAVKEHKMGKGALECAVCLSEFQEDDTLRLLPKCDHVFHPDCIGAWLASHVTCPVCRAKVTPEESNEESKPTTESNNELSQNQSNSASIQNAVVIDINGEQNGEVQVQVHDNASNVNPKRNGSPRTRVCGKFPRSHSTGHSLGGNNERYRLRLPEEVRRQIVLSGKIKRAQSFNVVLGTEGSSRKGCDGGDGSSRGRSVADRWVLSRTPPFVSRISLASGKTGGGGEVDGSMGRSWLVSVKLSKCEG